MLTRLLNLDNGQKVEVIGSPLFRHIIHVNWGVRPCSGGESSHQFVLSGNDELHWPDRFFWSPV